MTILVDMINPSCIETRRTTDDTMNLWIDFTEVGRGKEENTYRKLSDKNSANRI
jgi:hypothetical protein